MASTEKQFNGQKIDSVSINKSELKITKFTYSIAQDIWGTYKVKLPINFGYVEHDTLVQGTFNCNNWQIVRYNKLKKWTEPLSSYDF